MDYEQKYKEALERARKLYNDAMANEYKSDMEDYESIFPELAENEDEKALRIIKKRMCYDAFPLSDEDRRIVKNWLEKQKKQKPVDLQVKGDGVYKICPRCKERMVRDDSMVYTSMPPQYRYECPKCGERECDTVMYDNPEMEEQKPWKVGANAYFTPEQKPADLSEMMVHKEPYIAPVPTPMVADEQKPVEPSGKLSRQDYLYQLLIDQLITYSDYEYLIGQKPAEWSEEEKRKLNRIYSIIGWAMDEHAFSSCKKLLGDKEGVELQDFLRSIAKPKPEWSEEDIKKIRSEEYTKGFNDAAFGGKLKEWSVEDEDRIRQIERIAQQAGCTQKLQEEIHDWFKSLRPHWKPSEEQMKALLNIEGDLRAFQYNDKAKIIAELYEQLKRL